MRDIIVRRFATAALAVFVIEIGEPKRIGEPYENVQNDWQSARCCRDLRSIFDKHCSSSRTDY
ncbi:MAG: hypothetical protein FJX55_07410 [Alphaproteobacteria bacterium]|nr:hypothetical protein [Alphaproteobacteria bacterium]